MCQNHQSGLKHGFMVNMNYLMRYLHGTLSVITLLLLLIQMCVQEDKPSSQERYSETDGCTCMYMQPNRSPLSFTLTF